MKISEVAFIAYPVTDVARARSFYEGVLGLSASLEHEIQPGVWWIEYEIAGVAVAISNAWPPSGQSGPGVAFEVESLEESLAELKAAGVVVTYGPMDSPVCDFFGVKDPDGNDITFHKRKSAS